MFNKEKKVKKEKDAKKDGKKDDKKPFTKLPEVSEELDDYDRPMHKVKEQDFLVEIARVYPQMSTW